MKKIIALMLVMMALMIECVTLIPAETVAAVDAGSSFERLKGLNILPADFHETGGMNRGEFAKILASLYDDNAVDANVTYFNDIDGVTDAETCRAVNLLAAYGILKGNPNGVYQAGAPLVFSEAVTALVRVLGYEYEAEENGGYPLGYLSAAAKIGLTNGLSGNEAINTAVAKLIDNALDIKVLNRVNWGDTFELQVGKETLMESLMNIKTGRGVVYAVGGMALESSYAVDEQYVRIGEQLLRLDKSKCKMAQALLGRTVKFYYRSEPDEDILYYCMDTRKEEVLTIDLNTNPVQKNGAITYEDESGKLRTVSTVAAPYVVYNGRPISKIPEWGSNGTLTCIASSRDQYDILIIEDYKTYVVDQVNDNGTAIVAKYAQDALPDLSEVQELYLQDSNGGDMKLSDITKNDVLSVAASMDEKHSYMMIRLSRRRFIGKLEEVSGTAPVDYRLRISAEEYSVTPEFYTYLSGRNISAMLGLVDYFHVDVFGNVAHVDSVTVTGRDVLGYLMAVAKDSGAFGTTEIKVFSQGGYFEELTLSSRMRLNGEKSIGGRAAREWFADNVTAGQLITYRTDDAGEVIQIDTAADSPRDGLYKVTDVSSRYRSGQKTFKSKFIMRDDTVVFVLPNSDNAKNERYYKIGTPSIFWDGTTYNVSAYALAKDSYTVDAVVYQEDYDGSREKPFAAVVDDVCQTLDGEGNQIELMKLWSASGSYIKLPVKAGAERMELHRGDIISYTRNFDNEIVSYTMVYSRDTDTWYPASNPYTNDNVLDEVRYGIATPEGLDGTVLKVRYPDNSAEYFDVARTKIMVVRRDGKELVIEEGAIADLLRDIDKVFVYAPYNSPAVIYAYEQ